MRLALSPRERLILALDVSSADQACHWVERLRNEIGVFKIGLQLFTAAGPEVVRRVREAGGEVFLDLKLHDIPNTVAGAVTEACRLGVRMLTLHTQGGTAMMKAARQAAEETSSALGCARPQLLGVTILTSLASDDMVELGYAQSLEAQVLRLARLGEAAGLDGLVCSPREAARIKGSGVDRVFLVTPGIRPAGGATQDQARVATAAEAVQQGADYLVVGRPVLKAADPVAAARQLASELEAANI